MAMHLTSDGGEKAEDNTTHLVGVDNDVSCHLVVVRQMTDWNNKEFVVVPKESRFAWAASYGRESYAFSQSIYANEVLAATSQIVADMNAAVNASPWASGQKAVFQYITRRNDPVALYDGKSDFDKYTGCGVSAVALKMNIPRLHISKLTDFKACLRLYIPSIVSTRQGEIQGHGIAETSTVMYNDASKLMYRFADELPETALVEDVDDDGNPLCEGVELAGKCNNGVRDNYELSSCFTYDPCSQVTKSIVSAPSIPLRVCIGDESDPDHPPMYYHDVEITGKGLEYLRGKQGDFWLLARFHAGNGFSSDPPNSQQCLQPYLSLMAYIQRIELVLKCTGGKFND